jgi:c-di-AMP phosphodiesterase-like protein
MESILRTPAITFFSLLNRAYQIDADQQIKLTTSVGFAMADEQARQKHLGELQKISEGHVPGDLNDDYSGLEKMKGMLG